MRHRALHSNSFSLTLLQGKPQYSIANSYAIGPAMYGDEPQPTDFLVHYEGDAEPTTMRMRDVRSVEWQLVSLVRTRGELVTYAGGAQKGITGNINAMSHDLDALVTTVLPHATVNMKGACCVAAFLLLVTCVSLRCVPVYLTGKLTPVQKALVTKEYSVRRDVIRGLLQWLVANNPFYADIQLSDANLDGLNGDREGAPLPGTVIQDHDATEPAAQPSSHIDATMPEEQATRLSHTLLSQPTTPVCAPVSDKPWGSRSWWHAGELRLNDALLPRQYMLDSSNRKLQQMLRFGQPPSHDPVHLLGVLQLVVQAPQLWILGLRIRDGGTLCHQLGVLLRFFKRTLGACQARIGTRLRRRHTRFSGGQPFVLFHSLQHLLIDRWGPGTFLLAFHDGNVWRHI